MTTHPPTENAQEIKQRLLDAADHAPGWRRLCYDALASISSLEHQLAEASRDAARYRHLRDTHTWSVVIWEAIDTDANGDYQAALDLAVDQAIKESKQ